MCVCIYIYIYIYMCVCVYIAYKNWDYKINIHKQKQLQISNKDTDIQPNTINGDWSMQLPETKLAAIYTQTCILVATNASWYFSITQ